MLTAIQTRSILKPENDADHSRPEILSKVPNVLYWPTDSAENVLQALKSQPDRELLSRILQWLDPSKNKTFNIKIPGPKSAQILHVLVNEIIPIYWGTLRDHDLKSPQSKKEKTRLLRCLRSVAGIGAILSQLRFVISSAKETNSSKNGDIDLLSIIQDLIVVLQSVLSSDHTVRDFWLEANSLIPEIPRRRLIRRELISFLASGKINALVAEAEEFVHKAASNDNGSSWLGDGSKYSAWLGRNIAQLQYALPEQDLEGRKVMAQLLGKALSLGYTDYIVESLFDALFSGDDETICQQLALVRGLSTNEQGRIFSSFIRVLSRRHLAGSTGNENIESVAAVMACFVRGVPGLGEILSNWLVGVSADSIGQEHAIHRAVIATLAVDQERSIKTLQSAIQLFGDKLYIKHSPLMHQEVLTQILLMIAGYVHRAAEKKLSDIARSSVYINAISNRIAASSERARFLGMVVGMSISNLVDAKDKKMTFSADELETSEGQWYQSLSSVHNEIGSISGLKKAVPLPKRLSDKFKRQVAKWPLQRDSRPAATSKVIAIEEVLDNSTSDDEDDLPTYEKPDSDPSDSEDDATLVQRNKPTAPVYIRDLISALQDHENYDRHKVALETAPSLIRRKTNYGTEVHDHIEDLATLFVGLADKYELANFQTLRLQSMIAIVLASPLTMGQWFSRTFFNGDYSFSQRASILTTLGLSARELAGFGPDDASLTNSSSIPANAFPTLTLPPKLAKAWTLSTTPTMTLSSTLSNRILQPLALSAADALTGPSILKTRTFSSRLAVEKTRKKPIPNTLAKVVAEGFFFPLTGRYRIHSHAFGTATPQNSPYLLAHYIRTLSLILHASGPSTLALPALTAEFWQLLLSLRPQAADPTVLEALLFALLTLLHTNEDKKRVAEEHARELMETQSWVEGVMERSGEERVRMLGAGVLVGCRDVVEKWERVVMGEVGGWM